MNRLFPQSIRWRLPLSYAGVALLTALVLGGLMLALLRNYYTRQEYAYLENNADMAATVARDLLTDEFPDEVRQTILDLTASLIQTRMAIAEVDDGRRYTSTLQTPASLVNQAAFGFGGTFDFSEIDEAALSLPPAMLSETILITDPLPAELFPAMSDGDTESVTSFFLGNEIAKSDARSDQSVSREVFDEAGKRLGTVTLFEGPAYGRAILASVLRGWLLASVGAVLIAAAAGWWSSRRLTDPLLSLHGATVRMAEGDLSVRANLARQDELGALARSFDDMAERVEQTVSALRRFVADAAHELNTPITALRTNLELARDAADPDEQYRLIQLAQAQVERLEAAARGLLDLSRLEAADAAAHDDVDLGLLLRSVAEPYASRAEQSDVSFEMALAEEPVIVRGDEGQISQAVSNLLDNAIKFTLRGGRVRLTLTAVGAEALIRVEDSGIGIPADDVPRLGERFYRGRNASAYPGSGLGLAIVKAIAAGHEGMVEAASGRSGTVITLRLPLLISSRSR